MIPSQAGESASKTSEADVITLLNGCKITLNPSCRLPSFFFDEPPTPSWDMTVFENRLKTLEKNKWPLDFLTPHQMASAGFFYMGVQDQVSCIYCSKFFGYWMRGEDPLQTHKRSSPTCTFITSYDSKYQII